MKKEISIPSMPKKKKHDRDVYQHLNSRLPRLLAGKSFGRGRKRGEPGEQTKKQRE